MSVQRAVCAGAGTFAEEVSDVARAAGIEVAAWIEGLDPARASREHSPPILWVDEQASFEPELPLIVGIGPVARRGLIERLQAEGRRLLTVIHPSAIISDRSTVEDGCVVFPGVIVGARSRVGMGTVVNRGVLIGHHTTIGRHCFLGPGANVAGLVTLGEQVTIALAAVVRDRLTVGDGAVVGAGAVAVKDVPGGVTVVGVPARPLGEAS
jgi:sugar O-acyltransferase (sialic acid O-acetyltransferase NeuD family)